MNSTSAVPESAPRSLSQDLADATEAVARSVVSIVGRRWPASGLAHAPDLVLTAAHAVNRLDRIVLRRGDAEHPAQLVGQDPALDLALLRVERGLELTPVRWRPSPELRPGSLLLAVSRPRGGVRVRLGLLGGVGPGFQTAWGARVDAALEVELSPRPGLAGAALADVDGRAVGLVVSGLGRARRMVLPAETVERVTAELLAHGRVRRGYLGVGTQPVRLPPPLHSLAGAARGLLVVAVEPGSPADAAGLIFGDVLLQIGPTPTADVQDLLGALAQAPVGEALAVKLLRAGVVQERPLTVGARP